MNDFKIIIIASLLVLLNNLIIFYRKPIANKLKINDYPDTRKIHNTPTPLIGGICILIALIILNFYTYYLNIIDTKNFIMVNIFYLLFFLVGLWDDVKHLSVKFRTLIILGGIIFLLLFDNNFLVNELRFKYSNLTIRLNYLGFIFTIFCFFALYNALNFIDGYNGVSVSISIFWTIFLFFKSYDPKYFIIILNLVLIYYYNIRGKLFLGNSGTSILSAFFCLSLIGDYNLTKQIFADEILFILFFPGIDMIRVTLQRIYSKKKIYTPDKSHFHHYLLKNNYKYIWQVMLFLTLLPLILLNITSNFFITLLLSILIAE